MDYPERALQRGLPIATRVPPELKRQIEHEAANLGVSVACLVRMKLSGRVPQLRVAEPSR